MLSKNRRLTMHHHQKLAVIGKKWNLLYKIYTQNKLYSNVTHRHISWCLVNTSSAAAIQKPRLEVYGESVY